MRVVVRVRPGSSVRSVGGRWGDDDPPVLVVRVPERAVDGRANDAVVRLVAQALGVPPRAVVLSTGATSRTKHLDIDGVDTELAARLVALLAGPAGR